MMLLESQTKLLVLEANDLIKILLFHEALPKFSSLTMKPLKFAQSDLKWLNNRDYLQRVARNILLLNTDLPTCLYPIPDCHNENFWKFYKRLASGNISNMFLK